MKYRLENFAQVSYYKGINTIATLETTQHGKVYVDYFCFFPLKKREKKAKIKSV